MVAASVSSLSTSQPTTTTKSLCQFYSPRVSLCISFPYFLVRILFSSFSYVYLPQPAGCPLGLVAKFASLPTHQLLDPFPRTLRHATLELASNNLICSVALTGVLVLQAGRFWAESSDNDEDEYEEVEVDGTRSRAKTPDLRSEKPLVYQRVNETS